MTFSVAVYQNEFLSEGSSDVHAVVEVASTGGPAPATATEKAVVLVVDVSGSMENPSTKIRAARAAAAAAINVLPDGTLFALVVGDDGARCVYPHHGEGLVRANSTTRAQAVDIARRLQIGGGTAISTWVDLVRTMMEPLDDAIRVAYLLTDGRNEHESPAKLDAAIARSVGVFECDTRGVGADWSVSELRKISSALLGHVDIIKRPEGMEADFRAFMDRAIGKTVPDVRLRVWTPIGSTIRFLRQVAPTIEELTDAPVPVDDLTADYPTGAWAGDESRDYHVCIHVPPLAVDEERLAARVSLVAAGDVVSPGLIRAVWTNDLERSTRLNERLAPYARQEAAAEAIREGLQARRDGNLSVATGKFQRAAELARAAGNDGTLKLLRMVVDIGDDGTVRVKRHVDEVDAKELELGSTRTVRVHMPPVGATHGDVER